jgi:hypothetical protein
MTTLTVSSLRPGRWHITRPDRRDAVILSAPTAAEAARAAAQEWGDGVSHEGWRIGTPLPAAGPDLTTEQG